MKSIVICAALSLAACSTGSGTSSSSSAPNIVKPNDLPARHRAVLEAWKTGGTAWSIERENVRDDPELARFVVDNLTIEMVQAFDRSRLAQTGQRAGPFERAQEELVFLSEHSTPVLVQFLIVGDGIVAFLAADTLTKIGDLALEPTLTVLEHTQAEARRRAAELLERLPYAGSGEGRVLEALAVRIEKDREWIVRAQSARALGARGAKHEHKGFAMGVLVRALSDQDEGVAESAAKALGELGEVRAIPRLDEALSAASEGGRPALVDAIRAAKRVLSRGR
ncbi:MAG: HEAT repeat domain-containing protein [Planctomycetota bacterium]|nr:HEAT repeat domain-containing protein [Planctomycetota bacterium]